jgi:hypothetical protein
MKVQDIGSKPANYVVQEPLQVTVREANPIEMKAGYNNGPSQPNQRLRVSDDTGTTTVYVDWPANAQPQAFQPGEALEICSVSGTRGMSGATVKISGQGVHYLSCKAFAIRVSGVRRPPAPPLEDPEWLSPDPQPAQQQRTQARPQQQALPIQRDAILPSRRSSRQMEDWLSNATERMFVNLSDGLCKEASAEARLAAAQAMAVSISIACGRGEIDFTPDLPRPTPPPETDGQVGHEDLDWGSFDQEAS